MTSSNPSQKLSVFLCHAQEDKPKVRELYTRLHDEQWIEPWLDEKNILPGQRWGTAIREAMRNAHVIIICLSKLSTEKEGHFQREIKNALDIFQEKPENTIFIIPLKFDECVMPPSLTDIQYHWVGSSSLDANYPKLLDSLKARAIDLWGSLTPGPNLTVRDRYDFSIDSYRFVKIVAEEVPYTFYIGKYPVTNAQYKRFLNNYDFCQRSFWSGFPNFNEDCIAMDDWELEGWNWLEKEKKNAGASPKPRYWDDENFGIAHSDNPVVSITWYAANAYCKWLLHHWQDLDESRANPDLLPKSIRLPLEFEWVTAAGGEEPQDRYPWDKEGQATKDDKEIARRANVNENIGHTTAVNAYLRGASHPYKIMDMGGNVWEWQANFYDRSHKGLALRGGAWDYYQYGARVSRRYTFLPDEPGLTNVGFRIVCLEK